VIKGTNVAPWALLIMQEHQGAKFQLEARYQEPRFYFSTGNPHDADVGRLTGVHLHTRYTQLK
jgi:hypothetical protein